MLPAPDGAGTDTAQNVRGLGLESHAVTCARRRGRAGAEGDAALEGTRGRRTSMSHTGPGSAYRATGSSVLRPPLSPGAGAP